MTRLFALMIAFFTSSALFAQDLVVYSGRSEALVAPLFAQFEKETGIKLDVRYNSTASIATQFLTEQKNSPADVIFLQESGYLTVLSEANLLQNIKSELRDQVEENLQDSQGYWLGSSARVRVLAYNTDKVKPEELPKDLSELTAPKWKGQIGWAPSNASMQGHVSALRVLWGEDPTFKWLEGVKANQAVSYQKNGQITNAVGQGELLLGWSNHYYTHQLKKQNPKLAVANYHFPESGKAGNILIISGVGINKHTKNLTDAEKLVNFLVGPYAQNYFANESFEYPTRKGVAANAAVTPLNKIPFATVTQQQLADIEPTVTMLRKLGLL